MPEPEIHDPSETYAFLHRGADVHVEPVTPAFWAEIGGRTDLMEGRLITGMGTDGDWSVWEMHPEGDEVILITSGSCRFHLDDGRDGPDSVTEHIVTAPEYIVVPKGVWHTMDEVDAGRAVVITWGAGTQHRPR
jgi:mannose-6-phosphate isomerase-like protein (cupin superfamily)